MSKIGKLFKDAFRGGFSPFAWISSIANNLFGANIKTPSLLGAASSYVNAKTGAGLTGAQIDQNDWNASESEKQRAWEEQMDNTKYQRQTADMQAAGLNPAMMYGQGYSASAPSGSAASGSPDALSSGLMDDILNVLFAKQRMHNLKEEGIKTEKEGDAALMQGQAALRNAGASERQAGVAEGQLGINRALADMNIEVGAAQAALFDQQAAFVREQKEYISKNYQVALKNADSLGKQAIAALRQADAATQEAATHSYIADYQTDLFYSESLLNSIIQGEHKEILERLPDKLRFEVENLQKQGLVLDQHGRLMHRQGNLATALTVKSYVSTALDVAKTVSEFVPSPVGKIGFN